MPDPQRTIRADLHNHSYYSPDSILSPVKMLQRAREQRLDVLAVTDHNTTRGGVAVRELAAKRDPDIRVIVGEEVRTKNGEVLGLFLNEDVPRDLSAEETIDRIHAQGGLAGAPHPYDPFRSSLGDHLFHLRNKIDFIERPRDPRRPQRQRARFRSAARHPDDGSQRRALAEGDRALLRGDAELQDAAGVPAVAAGRAPDRAFVVAGVSDAVDGFIAKPISIKPFLAAVQRALKVLDDPRRVFPLMVRGKMTFFDKIKPDAACRGQFNVTFENGIDFANGRTVYGPFTAKVPP